MEDRKRPASHAHDESGPPLKRHASTVNGTGKVDRDAEMPWKDDLERFQKDAIYRQMQEYKRERNHLEARIGEMTKNSAYHDEHLRVIDAWWRQLLDEVKLLVGHVSDPALKDDTATPNIPAALFFAGNDKFQLHLESRSQDIKGAVSHLFKSLPRSTSQDVEQLQSRISSLLAAEKGHRVELDRVQQERDTLQDRLEAASLRYMLAEKKLDRAKSVAVAKLERQAIQGGSNDGGSGIGGGNDAAANARKEVPDGTNGVGDHGSSNDNAEIARQEAVAISTKQQAQIERLASDNSLLTQKLSNATVKLSNLSDDDYARTELFRAIRSQYEDVVKRVNHLEATNLELREEAKKLQAERTTYRSQIEAELQAPVGELEAQLARSETDLARIRTTRDELSADVAIRKSTQDHERVTYDRIKELVAAKDDRIAALESEVHRLEIQPGQSEPEEAGSGLDGLGAEELSKKFRALEQEYKMLTPELTSLSNAFKKASALASKKVLDAVALEEKVSRLQAEKTKADQKYFATMKLKEAREAEVRTLRSQNAKSAEIIAQLKEVDSSTRQLVVNLEKQLADTKDALATMTNQTRSLQQQLAQGNINISGLNAQIAELGAAFKEKDAVLSAAMKSQRELETLAEQQKVRVEEQGKEIELWKGKATSNQSAEFEMLRNLALCTVCRSRFKNTALKLCGHVFCKECVDERIESRSRKCPNCSRSYGKADVMTVHM
ncbi:MAG: hypothetical protein M1825_004420 [Sarcosagium campestre]|nr:MAG: hypothetical protein M1825_004420 [Sarcosagium campestre]